MIHNNSFFFYILQMINYLNTWTKLDCIFNTLAINVGFGSFARYQQDDHFSNTQNCIRKTIRGQEMISIHRLQVLNRHHQWLEASSGIDTRTAKCWCVSIKFTYWNTGGETPARTHGALPSPLAFFSLRKTQCSSLMCAPLKTMSWRLSASAWPTLQQSQKAFWGMGHCHCHSGHFNKISETEK